MNYSIKMLELLGLGEMEKKICKTVKNFGAKTFYYDNKIRSDSTKYLNLKSLLKKCSIIIICIPFTKKNSNFLNKSRIKMIKRGSIIINTSRAGVIDENFVINQAKNKKILFIRCFI